jgi:hypothetical protein
MLPPEFAGLAAEGGSAAELPEPLAGAEGEVIAPLLLVAPPLLGLASVFGVVLLLEVLVVEPPVSWPNATGAKAATDNAKPAPSK